MAEDDEYLVALIDGELGEPQRSALLARLERDPVLRRRYEALRETGAPIAAALDLALDAAPVERLRAFLPAEVAPEPAAATARRFPLSSLRQLAAGVAIGFVAAAALLWFAVVGPERGEDDWRSAVVDYMDLYTKETFAFPPPDAATRERMLAAVGGRVGAPLDASTTAAPGLDFRTAFILAYEGTPLAEVAFVDPSGEPVLLCVLAEGSAGAPLRLERRGAYALATWAHAGRQFLVIGRLPEARIAELAKSLEARL